MGEFNLDAVALSNTKNDLDAMTKLRDEAQKRINILLKWGTGLRKDLTQAETKVKNLLQQMSQQVAMRMESERERDSLINQGANLRTELYDAQKERDKVQDASAMHGDPWVLQKQLDRAREDIKKLQVEKEAVGKERNQLLDMLSTAELKVNTAMDATAGAKAERDLAIKQLSDMIMLTNRVKRNLIAERDWAIVKRDQAQKALAVAQQGRRVLDVELKSAIAKRDQAISVEHGDPWILKQQLDQMRAGRDQARLIACQLLTKQNKQDHDALVEHHRHHHYREAR